ncbi:MAG: DUF1631 family protein, partial [Alcanivoracaceae bacterium]|nr:DUF1631 family protein [Alcanivoracaceae bacterium]
MTEKLQINKTKRESTKDVLSHIHNDFKKSIIFSMTAFFDSLKGILFVFEQNSNTDYKNSINYTAIKSLISQQQYIENKFFASIASAFKYFNQGNYDFFINENIYIRSYQSTITKTHENDEMTIIMKLINTTEHANEKCLHALANIFSGLVLDKTLSINQVPISPFVIVNSLVNSVKNLDLNTGIRMIIYNAFDVNLLAKVGAIYKEIVNNPEYSNEGFNINDRFSKKQDLLDSKYIVINRLFNQFHKLKDHKNNEISISKGLIIQTLNIIQEKLIIKNQGRSEYLSEFCDIKQLLSNELVKLDKNVADMSFSHRDNDIINLVAMLFQYVAKDKGISVTLRRIIMSLHVSILKIALQDINIFKTKTNPVRQLMDKMSHVPAGFSDELNDSNKYVIKLNEIRTIMLLQTSYDIAIYKNLFDNLDQFVRKMKKRFDLIQKRVKEKAVGLEKIAFIKKSIAEILDHKMHDKYMPIFIRDLLLSTWTNVLVLEYLRHPADSRACQSKLEFVDLLLKYSRPKNDNSIGINEINDISHHFSDGLDLRRLQT